MADFTLNCIGDVCPVTLDKVKKKLFSIAVGDALIVSISNKCALRSVPEWARRYGHYVEIEEVGKETWEVIIEKTK